MVEQLMCKKSQNTVVWPCVLITRVLNINCVNNKHSALEKCPRCWQILLELLRCSRRLICLHGRDHTRSREFRFKLLAVLRARLCEAVHGSHVHFLLLPRACEQCGWCYLALRSFVKAELHSIIRFVLKSSGFLSNRIVSISGNGRICALGRRRHDEFLTFTLCDSFCASMRDSCARALRIPVFVFRKRVVHKRYSPNRPSCVGDRVIKSI